MTEYNKKSLGLPETSGCWKVNQSIFWEPSQKTDEEQHSFIHLSITWCSWSLREFQWKQEHNSTWAGPNVRPCNNTQSTFHTQGHSQSSPDKFPHRYYLWQQTDGYKCKSEEMQLLSSVSQHDFAWLAVKLSNLEDNQILPVHGHFLELDLKED